MSSAWRATNGYREPSTIEIAASLNRLAQPTRQIKIKQESLELVDRFERVAEPAEKRQAAER